MPSVEPPIPSAEIRQRAYELWDRNHRPEGLEVEFWLVAERELRAERRSKNLGSIETPAAETSLPQIDSSDCRR